MKVGESIQIQHWFKNAETPEGWNDAGDVSGPFGQFNRFISRPDSPEGGGNPDRGRRRKAVDQGDDG